MKIIGLDIGAKRVGMAEARGKIAVPLRTVSPEELPACLEQEQPDLLVVGLPRNSCGEETRQSQIARAVVADLPYETVFQDESLTSVIATERLEALGKPYTKGDVDKQAAAMILQDYLERNQHGKND